MDGVKVALGNREMTVEAIFAWPCVLSDRPPVPWWLSSGEGGVNCKNDATTENQGAGVKYMGCGAYV